MLYQIFSGEDGKLNYWLRNSIKADSRIFCLQMCDVLIDSLYIYWWIFCRKAVLNIISLYLYVNWLITFKPWYYSLDTFRFCRKEIVINITLFVYHLRIESWTSCTLWNGTLERHIWITLDLIYKIIDCDDIVCSLRNVHVEFVVCTCHNLDGNNILCW